MAATLNRRRCSMAWSPLSALRAFMNELKDTLDAGGPYAGWGIALLTATWGIILRALVGKNMKDSDTIKDRLSMIEQRLAVIEDRSRQRRGGDR